MQDSEFQSASYRKSRKAYVSQAAFEYLIALLVGDAFLAKLLTYLELQDAAIGLISSFLSLAFTIQLCSVFLFRKIRNSKRISILFNCISQFLFFVLYLTPFLPIRGTSVKLFVMGIVLVSYAAQYLVSNILFRWANSFVAMEFRALFSAKKEIISLLSGMVFTLVVGYLFDRCEAEGKMELGFMLIAGLILILNVLNLISLLCIGKEKQQEYRVKSNSVRDILSNTLLNKRFVPVIHMTILWDLAVYTTVGFLGVYKTEDLGIRIFVIQIINIVGCLARALISKPMGAFSDRTSFVKGIEVALFISSCAFLCCMFTTPSTWILIGLFTILYYCSLSGIVANSMNITYYFVKPNYIAEAMAIKNCVGGLCGFGASLVSSRILSAIQKNGNTLFGIPVYGQQVLAFISLIFTVIAFHLVRLKIEKLPRFN